MKSPSLDGILKDSLTGLDLDQQINVLIQVKTNYRKTKPPADTSNSGQSGWREVS